MCMSGATASAPATGKALYSLSGAAPEEYALNAEYSPMYSQLNLNNLDTMLNGGGGQPGLISEYQNQIAPALTGAQTASNTVVRTANLNDAATLTPQYLATERAANPQGAGLLDQLSQGASQQLSYGTQLTPQEQLQYNQSVRGGQAARGMGYSPSDVFSEAMGQTTEGQNLLTQRQGAAQSVLGSLQSFYGDPTSAISGMQSGAGISAANLLSGGGSLSATSQSGEFNPQSLTEQMMQEQFQGTEAEDQAYNSGIQSSIGSGESTGSGMMSSL